MEWPPGYGTRQVAEKVHCTKCKRKLVPIYRCPQCDALPEPMREEPDWGKTMYVVHLDLNKVIPHQFGSGDEYTVGLHHLWLKAGLGHYREKDAQAWLDDWNRRVGRKA